MTAGCRTIAAPALTVEVLSPSGRTSDRTTRRALDERLGVVHNWIVDPAEPSVVAMAFGIYVESPAVVGREVFSVDAPFALSIVPAALIE